MSKIPKYNTELLLHRSREIHINRFATLHKLSEEVAKSRILEIEKILEKPITMTKITKLRKEVNPAGIGIKDLDIVPPRKYTRKIPIVEEIIVDEIIPKTLVPFKEDEKIEKVPGVFKKGDTVKIIRNSNSSVNRIGDIGIVLQDSSTHSVRVQVPGRPNSSNNTILHEMEHYDEVEFKRLVEEKIQLDKEWFNCYVPVGTIINTSRTNNTEKGSHIWRISNLRSGFVNIERVEGLGSNQYATSAFNDYLQTGIFRVINITPQLQKRIGEWSNVVLKEKFKTAATANSGLSIMTFTVNKNGSNATIPITAGFTGNCQLSIIGQMASLIKMSSNLKLQLKEILLYSGRSLLLCDIRKEYLKQLEDLIPKNVFNTVTPYLSTNGSNMVICILNLSKL